MKPRHVLSAVLSLSAIVLAGCAHDVESPPITAAATVGAVSPDLVCIEQLTTTVKLQGDGFTPMPNLTLEGSQQLVLPKIVLTRTVDIAGAAATGELTIPDDPANPSASQVRWASAQEMSFFVAPALKMQPGLYDISLTNPDAKQAASFAGSIAGVPRPTITEIIPGILCDEQSNQTVLLKGSGFLQVGSTLPVVHVGGKDLPISKLDKCTTVPGNHALGKIQTCTEASLLIPTGTLPEGVYDATLSNPAPADCVSTDKITLRVVPPPTILGIVPDLICDAQGAQPMTASGTGLLKIGEKLPSITLGTVIIPATSAEGCTPLATTPSEGAILSCTSVKFTVPKGALPEGDYDVIITNPTPADCHSTKEKVVLHVAPPPTLTSIAPDIVCDAQGDQKMVLTGKGFLQVDTLLPTIRLGTETFLPTTAEGCVAITKTAKSCTTLNFMIPKGKLPEGDYDIVVTNPAPAACFSSEALSLHVAAPPKLVSLDPSSTCDAQGDRQVIIQGTGFLQVGTQNPKVSISGQSFTATAGGCVVINKTFSEGKISVCTSLTITIPMGTFGAGAYPIVVTNPAPADCVSSETLLLTITAPPVVDQVKPATVCEGGSHLTITGSGFSQGTTVTLQAIGQSDLAATVDSINPAGTEISASVGAGGLPGTKYEVAVSSGGCVSATPYKTITVVPGPLVYFADPEVVYSGVNTRATIYATSLTLPMPADAVGIVPAGQTAPVTQLTWNAVAGKPNRVQVVIPQGQAPGAYDLYLLDGTTCSSKLANAITVTNDLTVTIKAVVPPFGWAQTETAISVFRDTAAAAPADKLFIDTPRLFLNPTNPGPTDVAIQVESVSFVDKDTITAVVPKNQPVHGYDLIVVNPDGKVGLKQNAFNVLDKAPPTIATVTPSSIVAATGQVVSVAGQDFRASSASFTCIDGAGNSVAAPTATSGTANCTGTACSQQITINGSTLAAGDVCILRLTNSDGSYADYSAIGVTGAALNLSSPKAGPPMTVGRRALVASSGDATTAARFVYAIGGDSGLAGAATPFNTVEFAPVDLFGKIGAWQLAPYDLGTGRSFASLARMGRYLYVMGGTDGTTALNSARRAMILNPREVPGLDVDDLVPALTGLEPGYWFYRVSAVFSNTDSDNPGGESLPSDEFIVKVPPIVGKKIQVVLAWSAPVDSLGAPLPNVSAYRVYRTPVVNGKSKQEVLLSEVSSSTLKFTDDATASAGTAKPLALGSTGKWAVLPAMNIARKGHATVAAFDPANASKFYVYALLGENAANAVVSSYEYLPVTIESNGRQTIGAAWINGAQQSTQARWQLGAWLVDHTVSSLVPASDTYVFIGGGITTSASATTVEAGKVSVGGDLGALSDTPKDFSTSSAGYGVCAANGQLFTFGGANASPSGKAKSAVLIAPPGLSNNSWNDEGLNMTHPRYLLGSSVQSALIFLIGGQTDTEPASATTEVVFW